MNSSRSVAAIATTALPASRPWNNARHSSASGVFTFLPKSTITRDLYDVHNMIRQAVIPTEQYGALRKTVLFYLAVGGSQKPQLSYDFQTIQAIQYRHIRASLIPVLRKKERFDFEGAKTIVIQFLSSLLHFTQSELHFIDAFNQGNYNPDLLFEDKDIITRIQNHPMALWKTR